MGVQSLLKVLRYLLQKVKSIILLSLEFRLACLLILLLLRGPHYLQRL